MARSGVTKRQELHLSDTRAGAGDFEPLVRAAAKGDTEAAERLLLRAQEAAFRFSLLVCGHPEDAEDVMQDALLRTYRYVSRIKRPEAFRTWLFRTVRNACLMKRRRRVDEPAHLVPLDAPAGEATGSIEVPDRGKAPDELAMNAWLGARLRRALQAIPPALRVIVLLRDIEGLTTREVADVTGISEANVKTRLHRARVLLRAELEDV